MTLHVQMIHLATVVIGCPSLPVQRHGYQAKDFHKQHPRCVELLLRGHYHEQHLCWQSNIFVNKFAITACLQRQRAHQQPQQLQPIDVINDKAFIKENMMQKYSIGYTFNNHGYALFDTVCPNGQYQTNFDYSICSTWFDINKCDDSTCDTTTSGTQTRCNLNSEAKSVITSSGTICEEGYSPGAPYRLHQTQVYLDAWELCPWCCNWCNETDIGMTKLLCLSKVLKNIN